MVLFRTQLTTPATSLVWIPYSMLSKRSGAELLSALTIKPKGFQGEKPEPIETYVLKRSERLVGVPWAFGKQWLWERGKTLDESKLSNGYPIIPLRFPDPFHEKASPNQDQFFADMLDAARNQGTFLAMAPTRSGKSPTALYVIGKLGRTALVIVPTVYLAEQWIKEITAHLGFDRKQIGLVQGGGCDYEGKSIVVAVIHNLIEEKWTEEFYRYFGIVVWDECHRQGARQFSRSLQQFPSSVRIAMTATPKRRDGCFKIVTNYFGEVRVRANSQALACECRVLNYRRRGTKLDPKIPSGVLLNILTRDSFRNEILVMSLKKLYDLGYKGILGIGDRVKHLQVIAQMLINEGIPENEIGLFVRGYVDEENRKRQKTQKELEKIKAESVIVLATYGMMGDGVDIPRLDSGVDLTPRASGEQVIGRIRTPIPGKKLPVWFTVRDQGVTVLERQCESRLKDYRSSNVNVIDRITKHETENQKTTNG